MSHEAPYEILGATLFGPPPLDTVHYEWREGFVTVYGKNGVGKSRFLRSLEGVLSGRRVDEGTGWLHLRLADSPPKEFLVDLLGERSWQGLAEMLADPASDEDWPAVIDWEQIIADPISPIRQMVYWASGYEAMNLSTEEPTSVAGRVLTDLPGAFAGHLSLTPHDGDDAGWSVWASVPAGTFAADDLAEAVVELTGGDEEPPWTVEALRTWPGWAPIPVVWLGQATPGVGPKVISAQSLHSSRATHELLLGKGGSVSTSEWFEVIDEPNTGMLASRPELSDLLSDLSGLADELYSSLLVDAPTLRCEQLGPRYWLEGQVARWVAQDRTGNWIPLRSLSTAQGRWAEVVIQWLLSGETADMAYDPPAWPRVILIDEPELALHPVAIAHLSDGLRVQLDNLPHSAVIATTHAPQLLGAADHPVHLQRDSEGLASITDFRPAADIDHAAAALGVMRTDLLQTYRVFLVVEGAHDKAVFERFFGDEWENIRTRILVMEGSQQAMSVAASEVLMEFTEAHIVLVLDNIDPGLLSAWANARERAMDGQVVQARRVLRSYRDERGRLSDEEEKALRIAEVAVGLRPDRLHVHGLLRADIVEYFPEAAFGLTQSWASLRKDYAHARSTDSRMRHDFKSWLKKARGAEISVNALKRAVDAHRGPSPEDIRGVFEMCSGLVNRSASSGP